MNPWKWLSILLVLFLILGIFFMINFNQESQKFNFGLKKLEATHIESREDLNQYFYKVPTEISFEQDLYDFDTIVAGDVIHHEIRAQNKGKNPYFIIDLKVSCGCTIAEYPKKPIPPGEFAVIKVTFDSKDKEGFSMNKLSLYGNTQPEEMSTFFKVFVKK
ncbi:MAG: DUF1573 domain-containing protein [Chitinophagales bacterium]|jgi:hypothetical protein|nr:DUF1573 domain-containing protein [Chitinophagales bacterium]